MKDSQQPPKSNDNLAFLVVLAVIGLAFPIVLCGLGLALFTLGSSRVVMPAPVISPTTQFGPTTLNGPGSGLPIESSTTIPGQQF